MTDFARLVVSALADTLNGDTGAAGAYRACAVLWIVAFVCVITPTKESPR